MRILSRCPGLSSRVFHWGCMLIDGNFCWRKRIVSFSLRPVFIRGWWLNCWRLWPFRTQETPRRRNIKASSLCRSNNEMKLAGGYLRTIKRKKIEYWDPEQRSQGLATEQLESWRGAKKPWNCAPCSSSRHILTWPCCCDNYQRGLKEQAAQKGFGDSLTSTNYLGAREDV